MDFRGPRSQGLRGQAPFRQRGGLNNQIINHHPVHNQLRPQQIQQRFIPPNMNQPQWNPQNPVNSYPAQDESMNYPQQQYVGSPEVAGYNSYPYPQAIASPELMNSTPQPQNFPYPQQVFIHQPIYPVDQMCYQQTPMTTPQMVSTVENNTRKKFQYNVKENIVRCVQCNHINALAETELIKRDEQIESLVKELDAFRKERESLIVDNNHLRSQLEVYQSQKPHPKEVGRLTQHQNSVNVEVAENNIKSISESESVSEEAKKRSQLSPDAAEFNPVKPPEVEVAVPSHVNAEVPVVSAKGVMDEDADASTPVQEIEAATQVDENLFEETSSHNESAEVTNVDSEAGVPSDVQKPLKEEPSSPKQQFDNWSDEVDKTSALNESPREIKMEPVKTETPSTGANDEWDESQMTHPTPEQPSVTWRQSGPGRSTPDQNQQRHFNQGRDKRGRGNRPGGPLLGYGRGGRGRGQNDQDQQNDNNRGYRRYGTQNNQNYQRKPGEEYQDRQRYDNREDRPRYDNREDRQRYDNRENRQRYGGDRNDRPEDDHRKTNEFENRSRGNYGGGKYDDRNNRPRDNNRFNKDENNRENNEAKDVRESTSQGQNAWRNRNLSFNKEDKDTPAAKSAMSQSQGHQNNFNRRTPAGRVETPKVEIPNIVNEMAGDLFGAPHEFALAHCVGQDFRMGSGIAVKFRIEFKRVGELLDQNVQVGGCAHLEHQGRYIFYLVTKEVSTGKPKIEDLKKSLEAMKEKCVKFGVKKLAMPRIGCGLDRLDWSRVKNTINEVFQDAGMEIRIYEFNVEGVPEAEGSKPEGKNTLSVKYTKMNLVDIEGGTALLFFGTEDAYMDPTALSLNSKHKFEVEYRRSEKRVGRVCCFQSSKSYWVYALIIAKTSKDKVFFKNVESCCSQLSQMLRKDDFHFVGVEFPQGWGNNEKIFFEKVLSVFRANLFKNLQLWVCFPSAEMDYYKMIKNDKEKETPKSK